VYLSLTKLKRTILRCFTCEKQWKSTNGKRRDGTRFKKRWKLEWIVKQKCKSNL